MHMVGESSRHQGRWGEIAFRPLEALWLLSEPQREAVFLDRCADAVDHARHADDGRDDAEASLRRWTNDPATLRERAIAEAALATISLFLDDNDQQRHRSLLRACESWSDSFGAAPSWTTPIGPRGPVGEQTRRVLRDLAGTGAQWRREACMARLVTYLARESTELTYDTSVSVPGRGGRVGQIEYALSRPGVGAHYFDPVEMPFFRPDRAFRSEMDLAWRYATKLFPVDPGTDVVWTISLARELETAVGDSIGVAAAIGFIRALRPRRWRFMRPVNPNVCFTGALDASMDGSVRSVGGYEEKVKVLGNGWTLVYPRSDWKALKRAARAEVGIPKRWERRVKGVTKI